MVIRFRLLARRKELGLLGSEVAAALQISAYHYYCIEQGKRNPSQKLQGEIKTYFADSSSELLVLQDIYLAPHLYYDKRGPHSSNPQK